MDLNDLVNMVNEDRKLIHLNVSLSAENMNGMVDNRTIEVMINNNRRSELVVE